MADVMQYGYFEMFEFEFKFGSRYEAPKKMALLICSALLCYCMFKSSSEQDKTRIA